MKQGFSGSTVLLEDNIVEKISNDENFISSQERQRDLITLSQKIGILPKIERIAGHSIYMEYVEGLEELTEQNARQAGKALRLLHEQHEYPHPCMNGLDWLIQMAQESLAQINYDDKLFSGFKSEYRNDALIHSEPFQFIEKKDGTIVFIDIEGIGIGSRYQDLGFMYFITMKEEKPEVFASFISGYQSKPIDIEFAKIKRIAALIAIAYANFAEFEKRVEFGLHLMDETNNSNDKQ